MMLSVESFDRLVYFLLHFILYEVDLLRIINSFVMKNTGKNALIFILILISVQFSTLLHAQSEAVLIRLTGLSEDGVRWLKQNACDPQFDELPDQAILRLPETELEVLSRQGYTFEILGRDRATVVDEAYHSYEEIWYFLDSIAQLYPGIMMLDTLGYSQLESLPIPLVKISDHPMQEEDEIAVLFDGMHHAREPIGAEICLKLIVYLLENYGSDPAVDHWVEETEIFILPMINPEGWKYITDWDLEYPFWRKNKRDNDTNGIFSEQFDGVDLNRNYASAWGNGDPDISSWVYRGPGPLSESELIAKKMLVLEQKPVMAITYHSFGEVVIWANSLGGVVFPDNSYLATVASEIAFRILKTTGNPYNSGYFAIEAGLSNFWMYAEAGCFEYCIETGTDFIPPYEEAVQVAESNLPGALFMLDRVRGPGLSGLITDSVSEEPLQASYRVLEMYDTIMTPRTSEAGHGRYFRLLWPGTYTLEFSKEGYYTQLHENVEVAEGEFTSLDVKLVPTDVKAQDQDAAQKIHIELYPNPARDILHVNLPGIAGNVTVALYDASGKAVRTESRRTDTSGSILTLQVGELKAGLYYVKISSGNYQYLKRMILL